MKKEYDIDVGLSWLFFWPSITIIIIFCEGDPDLIDVIIKYIQSKS